MVVFHSTVYYFNFSGFCQASWLGVKQFKWRFLLVLLASVLIFSVVNLFILFFRLLDEILFLGYRKTRIVKPVFIISNPRSGTTYLHKLLAYDQNRFAHLKLYQTIGNAISLNKLVFYVGKIDAKIGRPFERFFSFTERILFSGWKHIHKLGWLHSEEDEAFFFFSFSSPSVGLVFPQIRMMDWINFPDKYPSKKTIKLQRFYKNSLQRFMYSEGKGRTLLTKNVLSTGRIKMILEIFPDARIVYPVRHPYESIPSFISMFTSPWKVIYPQLKADSEAYRFWAYLAIQYYNYLLASVEIISDERLITIDYRLLVKDPIRVVDQIYHHFGWTKSKDYGAKLESSATKNYRSKHTYKLSEYGLTKEMIYQDLEGVFSKFEFEK